MNQFDFDLGKVHKEGFQNFPKKVIENRLKTITGREQENFISSKDVGISLEGEGFSNLNTGKIITIEKVKPRQIYEYIELCDDESYVDS